MECIIKNWPYLAPSEPENWASKKWAIYNGILKAKGEIVIQTDADCLISENWIRSMVSGFTDSSIGFISSLTPLKGNTTNLVNDLFVILNYYLDYFFGIIRFQMNFFNPSNLLKSSVIILCECR